MLQTILMLAALAALIALGIWMAFLGHRVYRVFAALFGLMVGGCGVLFLAGELGWALTSMIVLIAAPVLGILLGVLGAFVRIAGTGLGGILAGYLYGAGLMFSIDTLLQGAIPPLFYTSLSVLLLVGVCVFCMVRPRQGAVISTAFVGSYMIVFGVALIATWMLSGGASSRSLLTENANAFVQLGELADMMSDRTQMLMLLTAFVLGLGCATFQFRVLHRGAPARDEGEIDWDAMDQPYEDEEADEFEEMDEEEALPAKRRRGLFGRRRREEEEDWDDWDGDEAEDDAPTQWDEPDADTDEEPGFSREEAARLRANRGAAAAVQTEVDAAVLQPEAAQAPAPEAGQTQVFHRIEVRPDVRPTAEQAAQEVQQNTAPIRKQPVRRAPQESPARPIQQTRSERPVPPADDLQTHDDAQRGSLDAPRFAPRAARRKRR